MKIMRFVLLAVAVLVGGGLGWLLLAGFNPLNVMIFVAVCAMFGQVFYEIDKRISKE